MKSSSNCIFGILRKLKMKSHKESFNSFNRQLDCNWVILLLLKRKHCIIVKWTSILQTKIILCSETRGEEVFSKSFETWRRAKCFQKLFWTRWREKCFRKLFWTRGIKKAPEALPPLRPLMAPRDSVEEITARKDKAVTCCYNACHIKSLYAINSESSVLLILIFAKWEIRKKQSMAIN